ncbi:hypothetical protein [Flavobacterium sp.]|uniref:hypothetical protein n=1 Tax=Flavobacterium sp. TaxID=239 RepID=UPI0025C52BDA|nr:hypothetical protein [Flavobacterium sp.]MBA4154190.1 hypothetical protein [Flavobacterium sp.]
MKPLYNPYELYSERQLLIFGLVMTLIGSFLGYLFNGRFDGIVDFHLLKSITFFEVVLDNFFNTVLLTILLFITGKLINSKTRFVDVLNASLIARIPFYILPFFNFNNIMYDVSNRTYNIIVASRFNTISTLDIILLMLFSFVAICTLIWFSVLLWNGFKVATNAKGIKNIILFIFTILVAEVVSKYIITTFN